MESSLILREKVLNLLNPRLSKLVDGVMYGLLSIVYIIHNLLLAGRVLGGANVEKVDFSKLFSNYFAHSKKQNGR